MTYVNLIRLDLWQWQFRDDTEAGGDLTNDNLIQLTNDAGINLTTDSP